ncbi:hypothetical protein CMI37_26515 [Candidatus Pacearchaeota archaeon]|nr:hypothetical protein [Candidatus Pacearchaeota archaeon]|tara:strand:- start:5697 stop:6275 length:579 start_codon:yes stop_codon:yes gene_type:complete
MRRIQTQEEIDKKKKRNGILLGGLLIGLLVLSTLGYSLSGDSDGETEEFNGFEFEKRGAYWILNLEEQEFAFQNLPQEIMNVSVSGFYNINSYFDKILYFVNLENSGGAGGEVLGNLERYVARWQEACSDSSTASMNCTGNLPVKSCNDNLIIFETGENVTKVRKKDNCVYISGDLVRGSDAFLYKLLGITA